MKRKSQKAKHDNVSTIGEWFDDSYSNGFHLITNEYRKPGQSETQGVFM